MRCLGFTRGKLIGVEVDDVALAPNNSISSSAMVVNENMRFNTLLKQLK
jgi:hypothetical protein